MQLEDDSYKSIIEEIKSKMPTLYTNPTPNNNRTVESNNAHEQVGDITLTNNNNYTQNHTHDKPKYQLINILH